MNIGLVNKILPFSSVDGPGNRTAIFLQGCNFNCLYCHNPETINVCNNCSKCVAKCPYESLTKQDNKVIWNKISCKACDECLKVCPNNSSPKAVKMSVDDIIKEINKSKAFISGITVSGGECTLQIEFLTELFREVKKMGLTTFADTNGSTPLWEYPDFIEVMDMAMVDVKSYDNEEHKMLTGKDNINVLKNVEYLASINKLFEVRTVIVPEVLDNYHNVYMISKLISSLEVNDTLKPSIRYKIIKYRPFGVRTNIIKSYTPADEMMNKLEEIARKNGCNDIVIC